MRRSRNQCYFEEMSDKMARLFTHVKSGLLIRTYNPDFLKEKTGIKPVLLFMIKLNYIKIIQYTIQDKLYYFYYFYYFYFYYYT